MGGGCVGGRGPNIQILNRQVLYGARGAVRGVNGDRILVVGTAGAIRGVLNDTAGCTVDDDVADIVHVNCAVTRPVRCRENRSGHKPNGDRAACGSAAPNSEQLFARRSVESTAKVDGGACADLVRSGAPS